MTVTGWDNGLSQDYNRKLAKWFMGKPGAMYELRNQFMKTDHGDRMTTRTELIKRLRITSNMMHMGEKIRWGQDTSLMDQAADMLEADAKLREAARLALDALTDTPDDPVDYIDEAIATLKEAL